MGVHNLQLNANVEFNGVKALGAHCQCAFDQPGRTVSANPGIAADARSDGAAQKLVHRRAERAKLILSVLLTFLGLLTITFLNGRVIPIDPVLAVTGDHASPQVYERVRPELGLDRPLYEQFWLYLSKAAAGDFGQSVLTGYTMLEDIRRTFPATLELATVGILFGTLAGVPLGVVSAVKQGKWVDQFVRVIGLIGYSAPIFWLGLMGLLVFYAKLDWVAGPGRLDIAYGYLVTPVTGTLLVDSAMAGEWGVFGNALRT